MKFSAKKEALADKLSLCSSIAEKRQTIPILSNVLLRANNGNLTIVATDLERQLSLVVSDALYQMMEKQLYQLENYLNS